MRPILVDRSVYVKIFFAPNPDFAMDRYRALFVRRAALTNL